MEGPSRRDRRRARLRDWPTRPVYASFLILPSLIGPCIAAGAAAPRRDLVAPGFATPARLDRAAARSPYDPSYFRFTALRKERGRLPWTVAAGGPADTDASAEQPRGSSASDRDRKQEQRRQHTRKRDRRKMTYLSDNGRQADSTEAARNATDSTARGSQRRRSPHPSAGPSAGRSRNSLYRRQSSADAATRKFNQ